MQGNNVKLDNDEYLLEVKNLKMHFDITTGFFKTTPLKAVDGVSFKIKRGETLGVVGESGCGKTTLGRTIMNLYTPSSGEIIFDGVEISPYSDLKKIKKEEQFEIKSAKYEASKKLKVALEENKELLKEANDKYKEDLLNYSKNSEGVKNITNRFNAKISGINLVYEEKCSDINSNLASKILELQNIYRKKYQDKEREINNKLLAIENERQEKIAKIEVFEKNKEQDSKVDVKVLELKALAKKTIEDAKSIRNPKLQSAKINKAKRIALLREQIKKDNDAIKAITDKDDRRKAIKEYTISHIVQREKIQNDYSVEKSKIIGEYQNIVNMTKLDLYAQIAQARLESDYYNYIDTLRVINKDAKEKKREVKSSSRIRMKDFRKKCTMVFQDPYSSLNPRMTVADIIAEPLDVNKLYSTKEERRSIILDLMRKVGLSPEHSTRYAHEFSGGQRQRIGIARALAVNPKFIVCDEPVSALDVSIQAQVINTFEDLQKELGLTYLFIAHDLLVVRHISDRIAVMYLGKVVELAQTNDLYESPMHPYTISLLSAVPVPDPIQARVNKRIILEGDVPSPLNVPTGCPFRTRCPRACERCKDEVPTLKEVKPGHFVSCIVVQEEQKTN